MDFWNSGNICMNTEKKIYSGYPEWHIVQIIHHIKQILQGDFKWYIEVNF